MVYMAEQSSLALHQGGPPTPPSLPVGFGQNNLPAVGVNETASSSAAAYAEAITKAKFCVAIARPRDWGRVRDKLHQACSRPRFAEVAIYKKPMGGETIEGPSVRFAEAASRAMGNLDTSSIVTYDDDEKRIVQVTVTDLESNESYTRPIVVEKTVERRYKRDREIISERKNTQGKTVYIVRATDDELFAKQNSLEAKHERTLQLKFLPSDILEEALEVCRQTIRDQRSGGDDRATRLDRMVEAFDKLGVSAPDILRYMQSDEINKLSTTQIDDLRKIHETIRDGEATWQDYVDAMARD